MVRLHRALAQFMIDTHVEKNGLTEVWTPVLVREEAMLGTGQLPKFAEDSYQTDQRLVADPDLRGDADQPRRRPDPRRGRPADPDDRPHPVLPLRGRVGRQGHRRHAAPAPVREGRDGVDHPARGQPRRAGADDRLRPGRSSRRSACPTAPWCSPTGDMGFARPPHPRPRGLAAGPGHLPRDLVGLGLRRLPGAAHERPLPPRRGRASRSSSTR